MEACPCYFSPRFLITTFNIFTFVPILSAFDMEQICVSRHCRGRERDLIPRLADDKLFLNVACVSTVRAIEDI